MDTQRSKLASFYDRHLAIVADGILEWTSQAPPRHIPIAANHVAVARSESYAIDRDGRLLQWSDAYSKPTSLGTGIAYARAGESGVLAVTQEGRLLQVTPAGDDWITIARDVKQAWVGDSSDYYVTLRGKLHVRGLAHRGQYGDGLLTAVEGWKHVADNVVHVCAHTGHALLLKSDGAVEGTGGNRFGPLGMHGYGDKADRWGTIFDGAVQIATGARNSAAIRTDGSLWLWGEHVGLVPQLVLEGVTGVACGEHHVLARTMDDTLWFWAAGAKPVPLVR